MKKIIFIVLLIVVVFGLVGIYYSNKSEPTYNQTVDSRIIYDEDGKEMQKIKKMLYTELRK